MAKQVEQSEAAKLRIRREDCDRVKHDSLFTDWKILVGASDWQEQAAGNEGASRYRLHNLPSPRFSLPGVYELGIFPRRRALVTASALQQQQQQQGSGRRIRREDVVAVYVGQAENVRQRLQRYGQAGSHLETGVVAVGVTVAASQFASKPAPASAAAAAVVRVSKSEWAEAGDPAAAVAAKGGGGSDALQQQGHQHQLFSKVFADGRAIVFRWAMAESKEAAKKVEDDLLAVFDYAWNRGQNGYRRPHDVYSKLHHQDDGEVSCFGALSFLAYLKWVLSGRHRRGVVVAVRNPNRVLKQPDLINASVLKVADALQVDETWKKRKEDKKDRGVGDGTPPQRQQRHRDDDDELRSGANNKREEARWQECDDGDDKERVRIKVQEAKKPPSSPSCGYVLEDGSECVTPPPKGRRRCEEHKGMRIKAVASAAAAPRRTRA